MSAFSSESESSMVTYLIGIAFLILIGTGASFLMEDENTAETLLKEPESPLILEHTTLIELDEKIDEARRQLALQKVASLRTSKAQAWQNQLRDLAESQKLAEKEEGQLLTEIEKLKADWKSYREERRIDLRKEMLGKKMATLETLSGKIYQQVKITRITDGGMSINHRLGSARISITELPLSIREELDLDLKKAAEALEKERAQRASRLSILEKNLEKQQAEKQALDSSKNDLDLPSLKNEVRQLMAKRQQLLQEAYDARKNDFDSKSDLTLDRFETWKGRARKKERIARQYLEKAHGLVATIKAEDPGYRMPQFTR